MKNKRLLRASVFSTINLAFSLALTAVLIPNTVMALPFEIGGKVGWERFKWEEFDQNDQQIVQESGYRDVISGFLHSKPESDRMPHFVYGAEIKLYFSNTIDYQDNNPVNANEDYETEYSGISLEGEAGFRAGRMPFAWDFIAKIGLDSWTRIMDEDMDITTRDVQAEEQTYTISTVRFGTGPVWRAGRWYGKIIAGVKMPIAGTVIIDDDNSEYDKNSDDNLDFDIDGNPTPFFTFSNNIRVSERVLIKIDLFYDTYSFDRSKTKTSDLDNLTTADVTIPESEQTNYGIQGGVSMDFK